MGSRQLLKKENGSFLTSLKQPHNQFAELLLLVLLAALVFAVYSNSLQVPFLFDDISNIKENPHIQLAELSLKEIAEAAFKSPLRNRPVANISFAFNYYLHGYEVFGYHLVNILIHLANGLLLYLFAKQTLRFPCISKRYKQSKWIPFVTTFIWLVHPIQIQSVTYVVQRMNSMAILFYMLSFLLYIKARSIGPQNRSWALYTGSLLAGILAFGSKEISATLPVFILVYEWFFFQDLDRSWLKRNLVRLLMLLPVLVLITILYLGIHPLERILATYEIRDFTLGQRVLTEFRVVIFYLSLLVLPLPSRLNLQHDFVLSNSIVDPPSTLIAIITVVLLLGLSICLARRDRLISFCILWFLGNLVIESSVIGLEIIYEHRNYLPSMLILLMVVSLALQYNRFQVHVIGVMCSVALLFAIWTYQRNYTWTDDLLLWQDSVEKSPSMARPRNNWANALSRRRQHSAAIEQLELAIQLQAGNARTHFNLANEYREVKKANEAIKHYTLAIKFLPDYAFAHNNLAVLLNDMGMTSQAIEHYLHALEIDPTFAEAHNNLGVAYAKQGEYQKALQHYEKSLSLYPRDIYAQKNIASVYNELGSQLAKQGMTSQAIEHYSQALRFWPAYAEVHFNLGIQLAKQGMTSQAIEHYSEAIKIQPDFYEAHTNLGIALNSQGDYRKALKHFREALKANPNSAEIHNSLGVALIKMGRLEKAIEHFSTAVNINPSYVKAKRNLNAGLLLRGRQ